MAKVSEQKLRREPRVERLLKRRDAHSSLALKIEARLHAIIDGSDVAWDRSGGKILLHITPRHRVGDRVTYPCETALKIAEFILNSYDGDENDEAEIEESADEKKRSWRDNCLDEILQPIGVIR
jgi:hypothetical protein